MRLPTNIVLVAGANRTVAGVDAKAMHLALWLSAKTIGLLAKMCGCRLYAADWTMVVDQMNGVAVGFLVCGENGRSLIAPHYS